MLVCYPFGSWRVLALIYAHALGLKRSGVPVFSHPAGRGGVSTGPQRLHSPLAWRALLRGSLGLADAYANGWVDSPDLVALIRLAARNGRAIDRPRRVLAPVLVPFQRLRALLRPVTRHRSRRDIAAHYDLGNELFARMLDPTLSYSCAVFEEPAMTLEEAQLAKLERVCEKLELEPDDHLLEIGTGWGALACYAARFRGCRVTTTTISREQYDYALAQVRAYGLGDRVTVLMQDYRDLSGRFDKLVSIEMIEAVGWRQIARYFEKCSQLLAPGGMMLLQAITIDRAYEVEKASRSFIKRYIFPGGSLPSLAVITRSLARRRPAGARARGHHRPLRADAAPLACCVPGQRARARPARLRRALPADLDAVPRLLRGRLRGAADRRHPAPALQAGAKGTRKKLLPVPTASGRALSRVRFRGAARAAAPAGLGRIQRPIGELDRR
jgi:cyclopropane-fatty-acyl-phospholipid synthase